MDNRGLDLGSMGRELSDRQLGNVASAVKAALFAAIVLQGSASMRTAHADGGSVCTLAGCTVWADPYWPTLSIAGGGGGGGGGFNPNCTEDCGLPYAPPPPPHALPQSQIPDLSKLLCAANAYGAMPKRFQVLIENEYAFANDNNPSHPFAFNDASPVGPAGYGPMDGLTAIGPSWYGGGWSALYADGVLPQPPAATIHYIDPTTRAASSAHGPFTGFEWALITVVHEFAHQNSLGGSAENEDLGDGYGYAALQRYRTAHGAACP